VSLLLIFPVQAPATPLTHVLQIVELGVSACAVFALVFAAIQFRDARRHTHELVTHTNLLGKLTRELQVLEGSLSTQYLGPFPTYVRDIERLLKKTEKDVLILCDYPAYACFSNSRGFRQYQLAIEDLISRKKIVRLICFDETRQDSYLPHVFHVEKEAAWQEWRSSAINLKRLKRFIKSHKQEAKLPNVSHDSISPEEFARLMRVPNRTMFNHSFFHAERRQTKEAAPIFFWLIDNKEAVFAISSLAKGVSEYGFWTRSPELVKALKGLWVTYSNDAPLVAPATVPHGDLHPSSPPNQPSTESNG
jgi:hypothetical protein